MKARLANRSAIGALVTVVVLLHGSEATQAAEKRARTIKPEEIVGTWGGFSDDNVFHLMKLQSGASGVFGYMHRGEKPVALKIRSWQCTNKRVVVLLDRNDQNPDGIEKVEGPAGWNSMKLTVSSPSGGQRQVVFHREDVRVEMRKSLEERIATFEAKNMSR